ncbi:MAG: CRTAC1 family protein, partial [Pirellulaceae bacterium]|nr:CRTAC1 family protein [Pirellulaceae bacterium]
MNSSNDTHGFREVADERAADSSGKKTAAHELSANGWRSALATLVTALMLILGCTGLWIYVAPFSRFAQVQVLVHVAAGLLVLIPYVVYQVRHFLVWRKQKSSVVMVVGYLLMGMTETAGVADVDGFGMGAWFVDLDNDGDLDLYVTNVGPNRFFENQGDGTFIENAAARGIDDPAWSTGVAWGDFDRDGHLDLYVCNYLQYGDTAELRNNQLMRESSGVAVPYALNPNSFDAVPNRLYHNLGDGRFVDIAPEMGVDDTQGRSLGATFCDLNGDGWLDLYVNNDVSTNRCWLNRGHELRPEDKRGTLLPFADFSTISGTADPRGSMGLSVGETGAMNNNWDGLPDLFITHWVAQENALYQSQNSERTQFQDKTRQFGLGEVSLQSVGWGSAFVDLDLDGREDLVVANGSTLESKSDLSKLVTQPLFLFWNAGSRFLDVASHAVAEQKALSTLDAYLARFDSPIGLYLHGYTLMAFEQGRTQQVESIKKYHAAAKAAADHAPFWFTAADTALVYFDRNLPDAAILQPIISESLSELRRLQPSNLWVIRHSLDQMAIHKDGRIFDYWNSVRPILERANYSTQNFLGTQEVHGTFGDYSRYLTEIDQVILAKDWGQIVNQVTDYTRTVNGKSPFVTDFVQLQPNLLDYLVERFSDGVMQRAALAETVENSLLKISFESVELAASIHETMAVDFSLADVDFDGNLDLFLLRESEVQVFLGPMHRLSSDPCLKIQLDSKPCGIATAYLGTVADPGGTGIARRISESAGREPSITQVELPKILLWGETGLAVWELEWSLDAGLSAKPIEQHPSTQLLNIQRCILVDYDHDADLDLVALTSQGIRLLMNRSNNTFIDASQWIELPANVAPIVDAQIVDWNRDVYIDLLVQSSDGQIGLLDNQRHGVFVYRSLPFPLTANHTGFAVAEIDGNASWDLISQKDGKTTVQFTETKAWGKVNCSDGEDSFNRVPLELSGEVFGAWQVGDFDNSGSLDFLLWADHELRFCPTRWQASPLVQGAERIGVDPTVCAIALPNKPTRGEQGDFDADGDLDLVLLVDGQIRFFSNQGGNQNNWLTVVPLGRGDNASRTNHLGIGGLFEVRIGHQYFAETVTRPSVHIGLGKTEQATLARIIWPNGIPQVLLLPKGKQTVEMVCILKGSCPF